MSRIIIARHPNGEEQVVCGWDRPLGSGFADLYDDEGECLETFGPLSGTRLNPIWTATYAQTLAIDHARNLAPEALKDLVVLIDQHSKLEYPASNVVIDLTPETQPDGNSTR